MNLNATFVAVILVNWNGQKDTLACLESLRALQVYPTMRHQVIVVDNASSDGSAERIAESFPEVHLLRQDQNLGFVGGNNAGIELARRLGADLVLLLNNDTLVSPDFLAHLVDAFQSDPQAGAVGPLINYHQQPDVIWSAGGAIDWSRGSTRMIGLNERDSGQYGTQSQAVDFVTGCAILVPMRVIDRVGILDERFFAYYEETEWCVRISRAGFRILFVPSAKIWHKILPTARAASPMVHYYMTRNRLLFLRLTNAGWTAWVHTLILEYARTLASWTLRYDSEQIPLRNAMRAAIVDFFSANFGKRHVLVTSGSESA